MASAANLLLNSVCLHCMPRLSWYFSPLPRFAVCVVVFGVIKWKFRVYVFFSLFIPNQNLDSLKGGRLCFFNGQKCSLQPESESQAEFFSILNNRDLTGQIPPSFTHLFNSIIIRFHVMAGTDKWVGFWFWIGTCLIILFIQWRDPLLFPRAVCGSAELRTAKLVRNGFP